MSSQEEGSMWSRSFDFDIDGDADCATKKKKLSLLVEEEWNAGIGGTCWEGGVLLARFLNSPLFASLEGLPRGRPLRAIELGSGVSALPCLVAARLTRRGGRGEEGGKEEKEEQGEATDDGDGGTDGGTDGRTDSETQPSSSAPLPLFSEIFATDVDECLPGLEANARKNAPAHASVEVVRWEGEGEEAAAPERAPPEEGGKKPQALKLLDLDWRLFPKAATSFLGAPFHVVLVADAVYVSSLMPALVEAMRSVCDLESVVLLAYYLRSESADAVFWPLLRGAFEVTAISAASFGCEGADKGENRGLFRLRKRSEAADEEAEKKRRRDAEEHVEGKREGKEQEEGEEEEKKQDETVLAPPLSFD